MIRFLRIRLVISVLLWTMLLPAIRPVQAENIDTANDGSQYVYGENIGWISLEPGGDGGPGVEVADAGLSGYMWGENTGWINLSPANGGVQNDGLGNLSGYAWSENTGWISFAPAYGGVTIDPDTGEFAGTAWGESTGWISFQDTVPVAFKVTTAWRATAPALSVADTTATEGHSGAVAAVFAVTLSRSSSLVVTVDYAAADGTALAGDNDYTAASGTLTFAPGVTSQTVTVNILGDTIGEPDETFYLNLTNASNATISDNQGIGTITDDDSPSSSSGGGGSSSGCFISTVAHASPLYHPAISLSVQALLLISSLLVLFVITRILQIKRRPVSRAIACGGERHE